MKRNNFKWLFSLALVVFFSAGIYGQSNRIEFTEYKLENGLHVILHQDNTTPNVVVEIMYHVGAKNENPERTGFAHFFEHLMFEGSKHIGRGEFAEIVERAGGTLNAGTWYDYTTYYVLLPSNQLELALWLESERMLHPVIDSIGIATQKDVVTEEMQQVRDNRPYGRILTETLMRAYSEHPYRSDVLGLDPHIRNATEEDITNFHDMFYVPNNAVLVVSGDFEIETTKKLIEKYFGDIPAGTGEIYRPSVVEPRRTAEIRDTVYDNIQLPAVIHAYPMPALGTPDYYAMDMLSTLLSRGQSSRLYRKLVDQEETALSIQSIPLGLEDPGLFIIFGLPNIGVDLEVLEAGFVAELERVKEELISEQEFQKLRNQMESSFVGRNTTIASRSTALATYHTLHGDANKINTELDRYMAVTREDIRRVANEFLQEDQRVVIYYLPHAQ